MSGTPLIWALTGARRGDNAQVLALARAAHERTGARVIEKPLRYNALRLLPNNLIPPSLAVLEKGRRAGVSAPPWPDLVIGAGRRPVPVARWITQRSGGRARLVWLGRPRAPLALFDLVLTTAQYGLPEERNVIMLDLPPAAAPAAPEGLARWREKFSALPGPLTAVLVGGGRWPVLFDASDAARLGRMVEEERARLGGAWIVSTSPRTGQRQARALHETLKKPGYFYYWRDGMEARDNPHRALLALADRFIVTADSASMIAEAVRTGRPVTVFPVRRAALAPRWRASSGLARGLAASGWLSPPRDMAAFVERLRRAGAVRLPGQGDDALKPGWREKGLDAALARIEEMLKS